MKNECQQTIRTVMCMVWWGLKVFEEAYKLLLTGTWFCEK